MTFTPSTIPVHREDGELVGVLTPAGQQWTPGTMFGYPLTEPTSRHEAEEFLQSYGLSYLAERWELHQDGEWITVHIVEASPEHVMIIFTDYGRPDLFGHRCELTAPLAGVLRMA